jgi:2-haloacid dehalogenase
MDGLRSSRRRFLAGMGAGLAVGFLSRPVAGMMIPSAGIKAVAFDGFAIFDPRPIFGLAESLFPGKGAALSEAWRARQFEYTWLRNSMERYVDFWQVTRDALTYAAAQVHVDMSAGQSQKIMDGYLAMKPWPDVVPVLTTLRKRQVRLALLSNLTLAMMQSCVKASQLEGVFEFMLSTDGVKAFKPAPLSYEMGIEAFRLRRDEIAFAAFAGWDAAGAKGFGYRTYWANRLRLPAEELGVEADATFADLTGLPEFVG